METKKKISLMIILILIIQVMLPLMSVIIETDFTLYSQAEETVNTWDISATENDHVTATFDETTGTLTISGTGNMKGWTYYSATEWHSIKTKIEKVIINDGVTSIGSDAFSHCTSLTSINIPESVTSIGNSAFKGCTSLTSITIPEGVTSIGSGAFCCCTSLTSINIPEGVTSIGNSAFEGCTSLTSINIPEGVTSIGSNAFNGCKSLTSINIPEGVTSIGSDAFEHCTNLKKIEVNENNNKYCSVDGVLYNKNKTTIKCYPAGKEGKEYVIPEGVKTIEIYAFEMCTSLTKIYIPGSVTSIGSYAFYKCESLTSISIPEGVTRIGSYAFYGCTSLTSITIPEGVTSIGNSAFKGCTSLTSINIPEGVTSIGSDAFSHCTSLTSINIPESVTSIGSSAFSVCNKLIIYTNSDYAKEYANNNNIIYMNIKEQKYNIDRINRYITNIKLQNEFNFNTIETNATMGLRDKEGKDIDNLSKIGTGMKLVLKYNNVEREFTFGVTGDVDGNGTSDFWDMIAINEHRLKKTEIGNLEEAMGDVTGDGITDFWDMIEINKYRLGLINSL